MICSSNSCTSEISKCHWVGHLYTMDLLAKEMIHILGETVRDFITLLRKMDNCKIYEGLISGSFY